MRSKRSLLMCLVAGWLVSALVLPVRSFSWGGEGHRVVVIIAQRYMSPAARRNARMILGREVSFEQASVWADEIREMRPETGPWHYIDIPLSSSTIDAERDCPHRNCVTAKIEEFATVLRNRAADAQRRREALEFVIHFVGDLHQPLHCEDDHDRSGNDRIVVFFGKPENLHHVWDTDILAKANPDARRLADVLASRITASERVEWERGTIEEWALEAHKIARRFAYGDLPRGRWPSVGEAYERAAAPIAEVQLERAGVRLAHILNETLK